MATDERFDELISGWLEETAPARLPERVLERHLRADTSKQAAGWLACAPGETQMPRFVAALGSAAVIVVAAALTLNVFVNPQRAVGPPSSGSPSSSQSPISGGMWPQSTLEEVRAAQELADAGDPDYTWQVDPQLSRTRLTIEEPGQVEIVDRFLREVLGWEAYLFEPGTSGWDGPRRTVRGVSYRPALPAVCAGSHEPAVPARP